MRSAILSFLGKGDDGRKCRVAQIEVCEVGKSGLHTVAVVKAVG